MAKIKVILVHEDGDVLDQFKVEDKDNEPNGLATEVRNLLELKFEVEDLP